MFTTHVTNTNLDDLVTAGYDHVRLQIPPGCWIEALGDATQTAILWAQVDAAVNKVLAKGLGVIICMYDSFGVSAYSPNTLLTGGTAATVWVNRVTVTGNFATHIAANWAITDVALELFNEPIAVASITTNTWNQYQQSLWNAARAAAPNHTLLVTAPEWSSPAQLVLLDPTVFDKNTMFVFHGYIPYIFAQQGYPNGYNNWSTDLTWPPDKTHKTTSISAMTTNVNADGSLSAGQKTAIIASQTTDLGYFFDIPQDAPFLNHSYFDLIVDWCRTNNIAPGRVFNTEWGTTRTNTGYDGVAAFTGVAQASRGTWKTAMKTMLSARGFKYTEFALDDPRYGITDGTNKAIGTINT